MAYGSELNQVWTNLIDNAIDAVNGTGKICVGTCHEDNQLVVEIVDNGPGIPPEVQSHMFEPFYTTKPVGSGTGLGLIISNRIVADRHGGEIEFESKPGETRFKVRLPGRSWIVFELAGANAVPIVSLVSLLLGFIIAFESAQRLADFGAQIYVANTITVVMVREMGPLMTAILLAGRSASAFAAEIGTMKVNEELNALETLGLSPIRFWSFRASWLGSGGAAADLLLDPHGCGGRRVGHAGSGFFADAHPSPNGLECSFE
jgi:hypothetical protein